MQSVYGLTSLDSEDNVMLEMAGLHIHSTVEERGRVSTIGFWNICLIEEIVT